MKAYDEIDVPMLGGTIGFLIITAVWLLMGLPKQSPAWMQRASDRLEDGRWWARAGDWKIWRTLRLIKD